MASLIQKNFRARKSFAKLKQVIEIPNLIDIQKRSYDKFLQIDIPLDKREDIGLQGVFKSVFPIKDFSETSSLEFVSYNLEKPKYDVDECRARGMSYAAPVKVVIRLVVWDVPGPSKTKSPLWESGQSALDAANRVKVSTGSVNAVRRGEPRIRQRIEPDDDWVRRSLKKQKMTGE
jgi:DNA-directed RNA polymerase beta subunit